MQNLSIRSVEGSPEKLASTETQPDISPVIHLQHVHKIYNMGDVEVHALRGVSLAVASGDFAAIMGPSGSGKSTMMNIIGCLDHPTRRRYYLNGMDRYIHGSQE